MLSREERITADSRYYVYSPSRTAMEMFLYPLQCGHFTYLPGYHLSRESFDSFLLLSRKVPSPCRPRARHRLPPGGSLYSWTATSPTPTPRMLGGVAYGVILMVSLPDTGTRISFPGWAMCSRFPTPNTASAGSPPFWICSPQKA